MLKQLREIAEKVRKLDEKIAELGSDDNEYGVARAAHLFDLRKIAEAVKKMNETGDRHIPTNAQLEKLLEHKA